MSTPDFEGLAEFIRNDLRLRTQPVAARFLADSSEIPVKARRPSVHLGKRVTICQAVTMARNYGWTVALTAQDVICVPALLAFGFSSAENPSESLEALFCDIDFSKDKDGSRSEVAEICKFRNDEYKAILLSPLGRSSVAPDSIAIYANPAQVMRLVQALTYSTKRRVQGSFGGKVECTEYLIAPFQTRAPRVAIPGMGDRIFSMTQDDEMVFAIPGEILQELADALRESGKRVGARYPVTFYQNFEPEFPKQHVELGKKLGLI